jgi:hypothetical protein
LKSGLAVQDIGDQLGHVFRCDHVIAVAPIQVLVLAVDDGNHDVDEGVDDGRVLGGNCSLDQLDQLLGIETTHRPADNFLTLTLGECMSRDAAYMFVIVLDDMGFNTGQIGAFEQRLQRPNRQRHF